MAKCQATNVYAAGRTARCRFDATGDDGLCTRHRRFFAPRTYTCGACGTEGLSGPSTCAEHKRRTPAA